RATPTPAISTRSLHDALPICQQVAGGHTLLAGQSIVLAERLAAGEQRAAALAVEHRDLAVLAVAIAGQRPIQRRRRFQSVIQGVDRKSTRLNSSHVKISYAVF